MQQQNKKLASRCKVLIIDDQALAHGYIKYPLEQLGFTDLTFIDKLQHAVEAIKTRSYDIIFCAYDIKREKDGYFLYDRLKQENLIPPTTAFIFISADTSSELINSILEQQPDDFLAKPFTIRDLEKRLTRVLMRKRALKNIYHCMNTKKFEEGLEAAKAFLSNNENLQYFPLALKAKGEMLLALERFEDGKTFYRAVLNVQNFNWAQIGLIRCLIALDEDDEAEKHLLRLAFRPDSQLFAYDLLTELNIKQENFDTALESAVVASEVSPRNIRRHEKTVDLSRLTHDYQTQFETSKKIVKAAKNSIYDRPEIYLNVARAGIDFAMTTDEQQCRVLAKQAEEYLHQFEAVADKKAIQQQRDVTQARLYHLQDEPEQARELLEKLTDEELDAMSTNDLLDRAKAYHESGMHEKSDELMDLVEQRMVRESQKNPLFARYVSKEKQERHEIKHTPRELNNSAVKFYKHGNTEEAYKSFSQAFTVMPKNAAIALNLLQTIALKATDGQLTGEERKMIDKCIQAIEGGSMDAEQKERFLKVRNQLDGLR
ncbi:MAG: response regulator [Aestuariibacter sp.]